MLAASNAVMSGAEPARGLAASGGIWRRMNMLGPILKGLITRGKVTDTRVGPRTLLQISGLDGVAQQVVELLVKHGANVDCRSQNGFTPLYM